MTRKTELSQAWEDAYSYKRYTERPHVVVVSRWYYLVAVMGVVGFGLLMAFVPNVGG